MSTGAQATAGEDAVTAQLFRYAQDLDMLMQQHNRLQKHHQMLLQSLGQDVHGDDLLPHLLATSAPLHWVSDGFGVLLRAGRQNPQPWAQHAAAQPGQNLEHLVLAEDRQNLRQVLTQFAVRGANASAVQMRLRMLAPDALLPAVELDALAMPVQRDGSLEIHWYVQAAAAGAFNPLQAQTALVQGVPQEYGALVALPHGDIAAVNASYCRITGYEEAQLLGSNPRILSSGRHDDAFFQDFWFELLDRGSWSGSLFDRRRQGQIFLVWKSIRMVENMQGQVLSYMEAMADLSYAEPSVKRLEAIANTDPLTGLPNRRMLMEQLTHMLAQAEQERSPLALLFIDLDRFKPVNDELGHAVGDLVLQEVAQRMRRALQPADLLARVGGDEFVVVLRGAQRVELAEAIGAHIQAALRPALQIQNCHLVIGASIGCARYPLDGEDMVSLLQRADAAMYGAKRFGMSFCFYDVGLIDSEQPHLEFDLWQALERQELSLVYQPQICSQRRQALRGCEALMRWKHPVLGDVEPTLFIALAERSGAIVPLGNWALGHACEQLRLWREQGLPDFTVSLNLSLRQLRHPQFCEEVQRVLQANGLEPGQLEMELSETQSMLFAPGDVAHIQALRALGVRVAIDDFGISFSSLSRLNFLSISSFKINAECVRELATSADARSISSCMIAISKALGIEVIAQGVETQEQASLLAQQGCHVIQGFYSGHPMTASALADMVRDI